MWGFLENKVRDRFSPLRTLAELETAMHDEWLYSPLNFVYDHYLSISHRIQAVIQPMVGQLSTDKYFAFFHRCSFYFVMFLYVCIYVEGKTQEY